MPDWNSKQKDLWGFSSCPLSVDVPAYIQGELSSEARAHFEKHLEKCRPCQSDVRESQAVLARLREVPAGGMEVDLLPRILAEAAKVEGPALHPRRVLLWSAAAAALVLLAAGIVWGVRGSSLRRAGHPEDAGLRAADVSRGAVDLAVDWLARAQEPSGGWSAARWSGQPLYDVGITGLAALALLDGIPEAATPSAGKDTGPGPALERASSYLVKEQAADGRFGPEFGGTLYNHGIATVALLELFGRTREGRLRGPIDDAILYLRRTQSTQGGWGYLGSSADEPNTALTCWPLQALLLARALGWSGLDEAIGSGFKHLARVSDQSGRLGYRRPGDFLYGWETLSAMGAYCALLNRDASLFPPNLRNRLLDGVVRARAATRSGRDLYRDFFVSSALEALPRERGGHWPEEASRALAAHQVQQGANRGSWEPEDPWSTVGGRIYSTATAMLILQADRRGHRIAQWVERN